MAQDLWCLKSKWLDQATVYPDLCLCWWDAQWRGDMGRVTLCACIYSIHSSDRTQFLSLFPYLGNS